MSISLRVKGQKGRMQKVESQPDKPDRLRAQPDSEGKHYIH